MLLQHVSNTCMIWWDRFVIITLLFDVKVVIFRKVIEIMEYFERGNCVSVVVAVFSA